MLAVVAERDIFIADLTAFTFREWSRICRIGYGVDRFEYLVDTLHGCKTFLYGIHRFRQIFCGIYDAVENHEVVDEHRGIYAGMSGDYQRSTEP